MRQYTRRDVLKLSAVVSGALLLDGCGSGQAGGGRAIKVGYISPQTGPLMGFAESDEFVLMEIRERLKPGLTIAGINHPVEILARDSQSDPNRAADLANTLITKDQIDLMVVGATPETTNPVSDQCELSGVPCLSSLAPWQPWYYRGGEVPPTGYRWTYHFCWGLEDIIPVFINIWESFETNRLVGALWPNDGDGLAWSDAAQGFPPALSRAGFQIVDPGRYQNLSADFSREIALFKERGVEIVTGVMLPPDLATFIDQAQQANFKPKCVTVGKASLFASAVAGITQGLGNGLTTEIWWSPSYPFKSSLTGASANDFATLYQQKTGKQWTQPLGFVHALFEVALDVLVRTATIDDRASVIEALKTTNLQTIVGPVRWGAGPVPNVARTPLVGGQWLRGAAGAWELKITTNQSSPSIPTQGDAQVMSWQPA